VPETLRRGMVAPPITCLMVTFCQQPDSNRAADRPPRRSVGCGALGSEALPMTIRRWSRTSDCDCRFVDKQ
jgi:hypothetical protein